MVYYAKIENGIVVQVNSVEEEFFNNNPDRYQGKWVQTSYNTRAGKHILNGIPLRKNYAGIGYIYDEVRDAFYSPQPYPSWTLDEETCIWEAPIPYPTDGLIYIWNEEQQQWKEITDDTTSN